MRNTQMAIEVADEVSVTQNTQVELIFESGQNDESTMPFTVNLINYTGNLS